VPIPFRDLMALVLRSQKAQATRQVRKSLRAATVRERHPWLPDVPPVTPVRIPNHGQPLARVRPKPAPLTPAAKRARRASTRAARARAQRTAAAERAS
jgi:hypothetical protein